MCMFSAGAEMMLWGVIRAEDGRQRDNNNFSCFGLEWQAVRKMADNKTEPFPPLTPPKTTTAGNGGPPVRANAPRPRRKSSSLGGEPRGDTGAAALATLSTSQVCVN